MIEILRRVHVNDVISSLRVCALAKRCSLHSLYVRQVGTSVLIVVIRLSRTCGRFGCHKPRVVHETSATWPWCRGLEWWRCTIRTTSHRHDLRHSCTLCQPCWTSSHQCYVLAPTSLSHLRRLRWTRPPSSGTYPPRHWWRTLNIRQSTTYRCLAGSDHIHSVRDTINFW